MINFIVLENFIHTRHIYTLAPYSGLIRYTHCEA